MYRETLLFLGSFETCVNEVGMDEQHAIHTTVSTLVFSRGTIL